MATPIDYDKGVIIRMVPDLGMDVCMYRQEPGVYYTSTGIEVPESLAQRAGFDTAVHAKARRKRETLAAFAAKLDREEGLEEAEIAARPKEFAYEADGFKVVALGGGRHTVEDSDGNVLTGKGKYITLEVATKLVDEMAASQRSKAAKALSSPPKSRPAG